MEKYVNVQDDDSHWFYIPSELKEEFHTMCEEAYRTEDFDAFIDKFSEYMTGGGPR